MPINSCFLKSLIIDRTFIKQTKLKYFKVLQIYLSIREPIMIEQHESEYLSFKNILNPKGDKYRSQVLNAHRVIYGTNNTTKKKDDKEKVLQLSKKKNQVTSKTKGFQTPIHKSPRSNCEVISFSTDCTKKTKQIQTPKKLVFHRNDNKNSNKNLLEDQVKSQRLTKAKSDLSIVNVWQRSKNQKKFSKKPEFIQKIPSQQMVNSQKMQAEPDQVKLISLMQTLKMYEAKIERLQKEIQFKNKKIKQLEKINSQNFRKQCQAGSHLLSESRYFQEQNHQNVRRLLNMLQMTDEYKEFAKFALDDNGIVWLEETNKKNKTKIDCENQKTYHKSTRIHFCSCNKEFIPEPYLWVPESIYDYGKDFLKARQDQSGQIKGFMSKTQYELLLYDLNKMWREREKRIINTITHEKNTEIDKLKRKFNVYGGNRNNSFSKNSKN